jgi:hypothetical protein
MTEDAGETAVLLRIAKDLEHLRTDAEAIGQPLLASLLEFSKAEANDAFNTAAADAHFATELNRSSTTRHRDHHPRVVIVGPTHSGLMRRPERGGTGGNWPRPAG